MSTMKTNCDVFVIFSAYQEPDVQFVASFSSVTDAKEFASAYSKKWALVTEIVMTAPYRGLVAGDSFQYDMEGNMKPPMGDTSALADLTKVSYWNKSF